ncbi:cupin domain-containing protein [Nonomuraea sp. NPDC050556]|uniref:cupin domain-containing protein n=1 Tax=Nonomuraea sp. NPDC050556 TaxID=3364369 RepID=UPI00379962E6
MYDWPAADGLCGGSPHMHLACSEAYVVIEGQGTVQTLTWSGYAETPLTPGTVVTFLPGTIHRLINTDTRLRILVIMQNSGLPEAGDAVLTFPPDVLASSKKYGAATTGDTRKRRDLAVEGFLQLRAEGMTALDSFHKAAMNIVSTRLDTFEQRWQEGAHAASEATRTHLNALRHHNPTHLRAATVTTLTQHPRPGMCGHLQTYTP